MKAAARSLSVYDGGVGVSPLTYPKKSSCQPMNDQQINSYNLTFLESLYGEYQRNPSSVTEEWRRFFETLANTDYPVRRTGPNTQESAPASLTESSDTRRPSTEREFEAAVR